MLRPCIVLMCFAVVLSQDDLTEYEISNEEVVYETQEETTTLKSIVQGENSSSGKWDEHQHNIEMGSGDAMEGSGDEDTSDGNEDTQNEDDDGESEDASEGSGDTQQATEVAEDAISELAIDGSGDVQGGTYEGSGNTQNVMADGKTVSEDARDGDSQKEIEDDKEEENEDAIEDEEEGDENVSDGNGQESGIGDASEHIEDPAAMEGFKENVNVTSAKSENESLDEEISLDKKDEISDSKTIEDGEGEGMVDSNEVIENMNDTDSKENANAEPKLESEPEPVADQEQEPESEYEPEPRAEYSPIEDNLKNESSHSKLLTSINHQHSNMMNKLQAEYKAWKEKNRRGIPNQNTQIHLFKKTVGGRGNQMKVDKIMNEYRTWKAKFGGIPKKMAIPAHDKVALNQFAKVHKLGPTPIIQYNKMSHRGDFAPKTIIPSQTKPELINMHNEEHKSEFIGQRPFNVPKKELKPPAITLLKEEPMPAANGMGLKVGRGSMQVKNGQWKHREVGNVVIRKLNRLEANADKIKEKQMNIMAHRNELIDLHQKTQRIARGVQIGEKLKCREQIVKIVSSVKIKPGSTTVGQGGSCKISKQCKNLSVCTKENKCKRIQCKSSDICHLESNLPSRCQNVMPGLAFCTQMYCQADDDCANAGTSSMKFGCFSDQQCKPSFGECESSCDCVDQFNMRKGEAKCYKNQCYCRSPELASCFEGEIPTTTTTPTTTTPAPPIIIMTEPTPKGGYTRTNNQTCTPKDIQHAKEGEPCSVNTECIQWGGSVCAKKGNNPGTCRVLKCSSNADCKSESDFPLKCENSWCRSLNCYKDSDCPESYGCYQDGQCRKILKDLCSTDCDCSQCHGIRCHKEKCYCTNDADDCSHLPLVSNDKGHSSRLKRQTSENERKCEHS